MSKENIKAMILGAGEGTRLRPLTLDTPKSMIPVHGVPMIQHTLIWLKTHGITEVAVNLNYLGEKIKSYVGDGSPFGMRVVYSEEETLLGTAGGVKRMAGFLGERFVVAYGDILTDFNLSEMVRQHLDTRAVATISLFTPDDPSGYGIAQMDGVGRITNFIEKPKIKFAVPPQANAGIYVLEKQVLDFVPQSDKCDFGFDVFPQLIRAGLPVFGYSLKPGDYWIDIGSLERYKTANEDAKNGKVKLSTLSNA
jgi:NDP-sugar pyrophosphorylase family protein